MKRSRCLLLDVLEFALVATLLAPFGGRALALVRRRAGFVDGPRADVTPDVDRRPAC